MTDQRGTYEVYVDVRHHKRHLDDWEEREGMAFKLVDTGDPQQMVIDALYAFADQLAEKRAKAMAQKQADELKAERTDAWERKNK